MTVTLLSEHHLEFLSLKLGFTGWFESTFFKVPHCWKSHVTAHLYLLHEDTSVNKRKTLSGNSTADSQSSEDIDTYV